MIKPSSLKQNKDIIKPSSLDMIKPSSIKQNNDMIKASSFKQSEKIEKQSDKTMTDPS